MIESKIEIYAIGDIWELWAVVKSEKRQMY